MNTEVVEALTMADADEKYLDEYDEYNMKQDKISGHHGGKGRTKKESEQHVHPDPAGHTRKATQKLMNNSQNQKDTKKDGK